MNAALSQTIQELLADLEKTFPYASALWMKTEGTRASLDRKNQSLDLQDPNTGIVFTVYNGTAVEEFATSEDNSTRLVQSVKSWANDLPRPGASVKPLPVQERAQSQTFITPVQHDPATVPVQEKLQTLRNMQEHAQGLDQRIVNAQLAYSDSYGQRIFLRPTYTLDQTIVRTTLYLLLMVSDNQQVQYAFTSHGGTGGLEIITMSDEELDQLKEDALRLLQAEQIPPGNYEVVADNSTAGVIAHECFGHGTELDLFPKKRAKSAQFIGKRVAAPGVNMFDDPSVAAAYGTYFFDDEGMLAQPTQILENGILTHPLSDLYSTLALPAYQRTANGRRESFARKAYVRMSNTFFGTGDQTPAALLESLEDGIYLRRTISGVEDPLGWGVQVTVHIGEEYKHGKPTGRFFSPVGITGYVPELLGSISAIGNDFELESGHCGKGHKEMVPVSTGGPHLRLRARLG